MNSTKTYKKYTQQDKENFNHLVQEGKSVHAAALELGINPSTAQTWANKEKEAEDDRSSKQFEQSPMNATKTYKKYTPQDKENLFRLIREGKSTRVSAIELGISLSTAQNWVTKERNDAEATERPSNLVKENPVKENSRYTKDSDDHNQTEEILNQVPSQESNVKRTYRKYTDQDKQNLFHLINDKGMSTHDAAIQLGINPSTAYNWVKKDREESILLSTEQEHFLTEMIGEKGVLTLDEMVDSLKTEFKGFNISKSELCHFAIQKYTICFSL